MILEEEAKLNREGLDKGMDISLTKDQPNQDIRRISKVINEEQS